MTLTLIHKQMIPLRIGEEEGKVKSDNSQEEAEDEVEPGGGVGAGTEGMYKQFLLQLAMLTRATTPQTLPICCHHLHQDANQGYILLVQF